MRFLLSLLLALWLALPAAAQNVEPQWAEVSRRAGTVLEEGAASVGALDALRSELVNWRTRFLAAQDVNATRITSLRAQIDALGPVPAEGETEAPDIAAERAALQEQLNELQAPVREAEAAFTEADALIAETDSLIQRSREEELLSKAPVPLNPVNWPPTLRAMGTWIFALGREMASPFATPTARAVWQARGVELGGLFFVAVLLLWRSGVWLRHLRDRVAVREAESPVARVVLLVISIARLVLPILGLVAVTRILNVMGASGPHVEAAETLLPIMGGVFLMTRWLSFQALPSREAAPAFLPIEPSRRAAARFYALTLGCYLAIAFAVEVIAPTAENPTVSRSVSHFVLLALSGLSLLRLGQLFVSEGRHARNDESESFWAQILRIFGQALIVIAIVAPLIAAAGYVNLANAIFWPAVLSLALSMLIGVLQGFVFDIYAALYRRKDTARDALMPTLIGLALALLAVPVFALIWGVRGATLLEWWATFRLGFTLGETRISPENFLTFAVVFFLGWLLVRLFKGVLRTSVLPKTQLDPGGTNAILSGTSYVGLTLAVLIAITSAGIDLSGLAIVAGALSVGLGFGLQNIVQNFVSGIILLIERPIKIGDWVQAGGIEGFVREISVRSTRIETFDRQDVIVPNADLISGVVTNFTHSNLSGRVVLQLGVAYGSDTRHVEKTLQEVAEAHPMVILTPPPLVTFDGFGADSLDFTVRCVVRDILFKPIITSELNHAIAARFADEGLEIPFAQRDIWLRNPEALRPEST